MIELNKKLMELLEDADLQAREIERRSRTLLNVERGHIGAAMANISTRLRFLEEKDKEKSKKLAAEKSAAEKIQVLRTELLAKSEDDLRLMVAEYNSDQVRKDKITLPEKADKEAIVNAILLAFQETE